MMLSREGFSKYISIDFPSGEKHSDGATVNICKIQVTVDNVAAIAAKSVFPLY